MIKLLKALEIKKSEKKRKNKLSIFNTEQLVSFKNNDVTKGQIKKKKNLIHIWNIVLAQ